MSAPQHDPIDAVERLIVVRRKALDQLEEACVAYRSAFSEAPAAVPARPRTPTTRRRAAEAKPKGVTPPLASAPPTPPSDDIDWAVSAFFDAQTAPTTFAAAVAHLKRRPHIVRGAIQRAEAAGTITRTGTRNSLRLGRPAVMRPIAPTTASAAPPPAKVQSARPKAEGAPKREDTAPVRTDGLDTAVMDVLKSGASFNAREMFRKLCAVRPKLELADVDACLVVLARDRRVERIPTEHGPRFRRLARPVK